MQCCRTLKVVKRRGGMWLRMATAQNQEIKPNDSRTNTVERKKTAGNFLLMLSRSIATCSCIFNEKIWSSQMFWHAKSLRWEGCPQWLQRHFLENAKNIFLCLVSLMKVLQQSGSVSIQSWQHSEVECYSRRDNTNLHESFNSKAQWRRAVYGCVCSHSDFLRELRFEIIFANCWTPLKQHL